MQIGPVVDGQTGAGLQGLLPLDERGPDVREQVRARRRSASRSCMMDSGSPGMARTVIARSRSSVLGSGSMRATIIPPTHVVAVTNAAGRTS
ncbi:hypothetical protein GCM10020218_048440 [Dactylosporangium vinaceum]